MISSFVGRREELALLRRLVVRQRLVSLVGPPGIGKSALAARFAGSLTHSAWPGGVLLVAARGVRGRAELAGLVARALAIDARIPTFAATEGCSSAASKKKKKGGGAKAAAAKGAGQKKGPTASGAQGQAESKGAEYEGVTCGPDEEGVAWCDADASIVYGAGGVFYALNCASVGGDGCAEDPDTQQIDCVATGDVE